MIISKDHILQEKLNNLTRNLLTHAYPLHLLIKNIKKPSSTPTANWYLNGHHIQKQTFFPLLLPSQIQANHSQPLYIRIDTHLLMTSRFPLSGHLNLYLPTQCRAAFKTILSTPHKHIPHHNKILYIATHMHLHTPKNTRKHTHSSYTILLPPP